MTPERAIAQLRRTDGRVVGLAFLVGPRHLMTCAHVVNAAPGWPLRAATAPGPEPLRLEFPFGGGRDDNVQLRATVAAWLASRGSFDLHDVAVLQIDEDIPAGVAILPIADVDQLGPVQMWGPTDKRTVSGHVSGQLMGLVDKSRFQIDQKLRGVFKVRPGFSGGPVWQPLTGKVVGILQATSLDAGATDAYVLGTDLIAEARRNIPDPDRAGAEPAVSVLHLSGLRFGPRRRLDGDQSCDDDQHPRRLAARILDDLEEVRRDSGVTPGLVAVSGDVAEHAKPAEYEMAYSFLSALREGLRLDLSRVVLVPGTRDISRGKCEAYFLNRAADDQVPALPYWPKWEPYAAMFTRLHWAELRMDQPWQFVELPELNSRWPR